MIAAPNQRLVDPIVIFSAVIVVGYRGIGLPSIGRLFGSASLARAFDCSI